MYGWGSGLNGRLGNESDDIQSEPKVLECFKEATEIGIMKIKQISCGENHTLALVDMPDETEKEEEYTGAHSGSEGECETQTSTILFVWGNNDKKQLGIQPEQLDDRTEEEVLSNGTSGIGDSFSTNKISQDIKVPH